MQDRRIKSYSLRQEPRVVSRYWLVAFGLILPYAVGVSSTLVFGRHFDDMDAYRTGELATYNTATGILTLISFLFGLCLCMPFLGTTFRNRTAVAKVLLFFAIMIGTIIHLVCVFTLRLCIYSGIGGIWP